MVQTRAIYMETDEEGNANSTCKQRIIWGGLTDVDRDRYDT
jgi:hypothetical protein